MNTWHQYFDQNSIDYGKRQRIKIEIQHPLYVWLFLFGVVIF